MKTKKQLEEELKELKKTKKIIQWIQIIGTFILLLILIFGLIEKISSEDTNTEKIKQEIKCIADNSVLYVSKTCGHCYSQKEILGDYIDFFTILECTEKENLDECSKLKGVPSWKINNRYYSGKKTLDELKEITEC